MKITKLPNGGELHDHPNGDKEYFLNGKLHREDGPAMEINMEYANGIKYWYIHGERVPCTTQEQFLQFMKLKAD